MRKRFNPSDLLPAKARPNQHLIQIGKRYIFNDTIRRRYTSDEIADAKIGEKLPKIIKRKYEEYIKDYREEIDAVLGDVYVVIPHYPDCSIGDLIKIVQQLRNEPTDIVAIEICKHLNI